MIELAVGAAEEACANCAATTGDPVRDGWHVFDDGFGEEHSVCPDCIRAPGPATASRSSPPNAADRRA